METQSKTETSEEMPQPTKPVEEHKWLENLIGEWKVETEMSMGPGTEVQKSNGTESVKSLGGLWAVAETKSEMPGGETMTGTTTLGYDVSFKEYRGCNYSDVSSHLWKYTGTLSSDGKKMTLDCEGPDMEVDGKTAMYRDVIELIDENTRTLTSYGQDKNGEWMEFMKSTLTRTK